MADVRVVRPSCVEKITFTLELHATSQPNDFIPAIHLYHFILYCVQWSSTLLRVTWSIEGRDFI